MKTLLYHSLKVITSDDSDYPSEAFHVYGLKFNADVDECKYNTISMK